MRDYEAVEGPYLRWLKDAKGRVGDRVWKLIETMDGEQADAILSAKGVLPYGESSYAARARRMQTESFTRSELDLIAAADGIVTFVPVTYAEDAIVEVPYEADEPEGAVDPRTLTDRTNPSDVIDGWRNR